MKINYIKNKKILFTKNIKNNIKYQSKKSYKIWKNIRTDSCIIPKKPCFQKNKLYKKIDNTKTIKLKKFFIFFQKIQTKIMHIYQEIMNINI